jgi:alcohol dehydrogenase (cytochrome c)
LWKQKVIDWNDGYSQTLAPLIADGVLLTGISGAEYGIRGFIDGLDPATGKHLWLLGSWQRRTLERNDACTGRQSVHASVLALDPQTGKINWHFQFSPNDLYDYDSVADMILATIEVGGSPRKVLVNPNRNGFLYVIDRTDGKLIAANQFVKTMNWATGVDKNGRPIESELTKQVRATEKTAEIWPSVSKTRCPPGATS